MPLPMSAAYTPGADPIEVASATRGSTGGTGQITGTPRSDVPNAVPFPYRAAASPHLVHRRSLSDSNRRTDAAQCGRRVEEARDPEVRYRPGNDLACRLHRDPSGRLKSRPYCPNLLWAQLGR